jgi:hypothetical protein
MISASSRSVLASRPAARAKGADLARVDHGQRQPGGGEGGGDRDLEAAGGLQHDERRGELGEAGREALQARAIARHGEGLVRRQDVDVEAVLRDIDADEGRRG